VNIKKSIIHGLDFNCDSEVVAIGRAAAESGH